MDGFSWHYSHPVLPGIGETSCLSRHEKGPQPPSRYSERTITVIFRQTFCISGCSADGNSSADASAISGLSDPPDGWIRPPPGLLGGHRGGPHGWPFRPTAVTGFVDVYDLIDVDST